MIRTLRAYSPLLLTALLCAGVYIVVPIVSCYSYQEATGRQTKYSLFVGCLTNVSGTWIPTSEVRSEVSK